ncbi:oxidosqualene:lanosterol cyclase [Astrocystis sublimbata]|nr:oxidosqualene:lanosterol cyclase [Astrocystis sublimbata]
MGNQFKKEASSSANGQWHRDANGDEKTDYSRWRLFDDQGRQSWRYLESDEEMKKWPQTVYDKHYLGLDTGLPDHKAQTPLQAVQAAMSYLSQLQLPSGSWGSESAGPLMLLPWAVVSLHVTGSPVPPAYAVEIKRYVFSQQHLEDGGWGWHVEGESSAVGTILNYIVLRLLGASPNDARLVKARELLHGYGGATHAPGVAKFLLCVLGVMEWDCVNPFLPEFWLAAESDPTHPSKWYIQTRTNFAPLSYVWSKKWKFAGDATTQSLRKELYTQPQYDEIDFAAHRTSLAQVDNVYPKWWLVNLMNWLTVMLYIPFMRSAATVETAEKRAWELIEAEDRNSEYIGLSVISNAVNMIACVIHDGEDSASVRAHQQTLLRHFWMTADGMTCNVSDGTQAWDTSLAVQAMAAAGAVEQPKYQSTILRAHAFLEDHQLRDNVPDQEKCYRQHRRGGWPWSTRWQGYIISECTAEGLRAVLELQEAHKLNSIASASDIKSAMITPDRLQDSVDCLLHLQNDTGGFGIWDRRKGSHRLAWLEMGEFVGKSMVTLDFVECTAEAISALTTFATFYPEYRAHDVARARKLGIDFVKTAQKPSGGWYAQWGICFAYGGMFALEALALSGETYANSEASRRGCDFLVAMQKEDGGWGESHLALREDEYVQHATSQVVQTAWVCLGLMHARYPQKEVVRRGLQLIMARQQPQGQWLQEGPEGGIEHGVMLFANYKLFWPLRALAEYVRTYGTEL